MAILWQCSLVAGNREVGDRTIAVARQRQVLNKGELCFLLGLLSNNCTAIERMCFLCDPCQYVIGTTVGWPGGITGLPCSWGKLILESCSPGSGRLKNRENKICSWVPWDSDQKKTALAMISKHWKLQARLLVREGDPQQQTV
jgi:hypothetical protein